MYAVMPLYLRRNKFRAELQPEVVASGYIIWRILSSNEIVKWLNEAGIGLGLRS